MYEFLGEEGVVAAVNVSSRDAGLVRVMGYTYKPGQAPSFPVMVMAVEHYNQILARGTDVELELDVRSRFHDGDMSSHNTIAEIAGNGDEIVMAGAHLDSWHGSTGGVDNASGCAVMMEAVRILKALDLEMTRTVRVALWVITRDCRSISTSTTAAARSAASTPRATPLRDRSSTPGCGRSPTSAPTPRPSARAAAPIPLPPPSHQHRRLRSHSGRRPETGLGHRRLLPLPRRDPGRALPAKADAGGTRPARQGQTRPRPRRGEAQAPSRAAQAEARGVAPQTRCVHETKRIRFRLRTHCEKGHNPMLNRLHALLETILRTNNKAAVPGQWLSLAVVENPNQPLQVTSVQPKAGRLANEAGVLRLAESTPASEEAVVSAALQKLEAPTAPRSPMLNGTKLRALRESQPEGQRTMQFVADCLGVTLNTVSRAESQNRGGLATVFDYSRLFNVPMEQLLIQK